eukprot:TRINITY_DN15008_c0_g2_i1.p1 TRINITY_DN15008_c0_g2~~TRINITY_DN15008_c0_g2_i1.p1  ORF type:complete len:194 (+),score=29.02 TRINITY_DN15008_c0_g2_i1:307-888(+)
MPLTQKLFDRVDEGTDGYGLRNISLTAPIPDLLLITLHGEGGDGDDWNGAQIVVFLDPLRDLQPRNLRQLDIHQNKVRAMVPRKFERFHAVLGLHRCISMGIEQIMKQLHVELVVFDDKDCFRHAFLKRLSAASWSFCRPDHGSSSGRRIRPSAEASKWLRLPLHPVLCVDTCLLYTSPSPRDRTRSRMPSSA